MDITTVLSIGSFVLIIALLVWMRAGNKRFEVKPSDIVVAVVPVVVFLLVTGKLQKFEIGEGGVKIETAFVSASASSITSQVTPLTGLPTEPIEINPKSGVGNIPALIESKTEGLLFRIGYGGYYGPAIMEYLVRLTREPFLKYIIIENRDGSFFGLANARDVAALLQSGHSAYSADDLATWLNRGDTEQLAKLPGFISAADALSKTTDKGQALQRMEALNSENLPVIDDNKRYVGMVTRSRLTASLLIDVAQNLEKK